MGQELSSLSSNTPVLSPGKKQPPGMGNDGPRLHATALKWREIDVQIGVEIGSTAEAMEILILVIKCEVQRTFLGDGDPKRG